MDNNYGKLTVYFEDPFWVGVFERIENGKLSVCKVMFGAEPKDYEVWEFVLKNYYQLKFSPSVDVVIKKGATNPKRVQREARKQATAFGVGTKSQQALQLQREENKSERKSVSREQREAEKQRQFELKQQKRKQKHRGR
ncbi:MAG: YjdF family protein [Acutalibacteraceae bacterium]